MPDDERDSDQPGVQFDDELLPDEFPPDRPLGLGEQPAAYEDQEPEDFGDTLDDDGELETETRGRARRRGRGAERPRRRGGRHRRPRSRRRVHR